MGKSIYHSASTIQFYYKKKKKKNIAHIKFILKSFDVAFSKWEINASPVTIIINIARNNNYAILKTKMVQCNYPYKTIGK